MVVVNKRDSQRLALGMDAGCLGYILECAVALIMKEQNTIACCDRQIGVAIVIVVTGRASDRMQLGIKTGFLRDIFELAAPSIVKKRDSSTGSSIGEEQIRMAIIINIEKACSGANLTCGARCVGQLHGRRRSQS